MKIADVVDKKTRSRMMANIRSSKTTPEQIVRSALHCRGFRFSRSKFSQSVSPDIVLPRWKLAVFIHGCFWHLHGCKASKIPTTNAYFWSNKLYSNQARDRKNIQELVAEGWRVLVVWECAFKSSSVRQLFDVRMNEVAVWIRHKGIENCCAVTDTGLTFEHVIEAKQILV